MKKFELELPEGYVEKRTIDEKDGKYQLVLNLISLGLIIGIIAIGILIHNKMYPSQDSVFKDSSIFFYILAFILLYLLVIVVHELIHGLFFKIVTKQKLKFGLSIINAYCGVPNVYIYRNKMILIAIMPSIIVTLLLLIPVLTIVDSLGFLFTLIIFAIHLANCLSDLYFIFILLFKFKDKNTLVKDTGIKKIIYSKKEN